jgi:hypothetical protein
VQTVLSPAEAAIFDTNAQLREVPAALPASDRARGGGALGELR